MKDYLMSETQVVNVPCWDFGNKETETYLNYTEAIKSTAITASCINQPQVRRAEWIELGRLTSIGLPISLR
jgi:hypothetical protein